MLLLFAMLLMLLLLLLPLFSIGIVLSTQQHQIYPGPELAIFNGNRYKITSCAVTNYEIEGSILHKHTGYKMHNITTTEEDQRKPKEPEQGENKKEIKGDKKQQQLRTSSRGELGSSSQLRLLVAETKTCGNNKKLLTDQIYRSSSFSPAVVRGRAGSAWYKSSPGST